MKTLTLKAVRISELATVVDSIPLKELQTAKDVRLTSNIVKDMIAAIPDLSAANSALEVKKAELFKANRYVERYNEESALLPTEEEKTALAKKLDKEFAQEVAKAFQEEIAAIKPLEEVLINAELADDKFAKLKELFEKFAQGMYRSKDAYLEVADALEL